MIQKVADHQQRDQSADWPYSHWWQKSQSPPYLLEKFGGGRNANFQEWRGGSMGQVTSKPPQVYRCKKMGEGPRGQIRQSQENRFDRDIDDDWLSYLIRLRSDYQPHTFIYEI